MHPETVVGVETFAAEKREIITLKTAKTRVLSASGLDGVFPLWAWSRYRAIRQSWE